jgi:HD-like signal output (HDOD) protein
MRITPEFLVGKFYGTVSPPVVYFRINQAISDSQSSLTVVSDIISEDPSLSARLLRLVNSPLFGFSNRIETISEAVRLVGVQQVRDLALVTTMLSKFNGIPQDIVDMNSFWLHSVATGIAAKVIAQEIGEVYTERYFLAGVMHDIGRLVLFVCVPDEIRVAMARGEKEKKYLHMIEFEEFGFSHNRIGRELLVAWGLPKYLRDVASCHHQPVKALEFPHETSVVHVADILAHALHFGSSGERFVPQLRPASWQQFGLSKLALPGIIDKIGNEVSVTISLFDLSSTETLPVESM